MVKPFLVYRVEVLLWRGYAGVDHRIHRSDRICTCLSQCIGKTMPGQEDFILLNEELKLLDTYKYLLNTRLGDHLKFSITIAENLGNTIIYLPWSCRNA